MVHLSRTLSLLGLTLLATARPHAQTLDATRDPSSGDVVTEFLVELAGPAPEHRRWTFQSTGPDGYVERLFRRADDGWELLTEWTFEREPPG